MCSNNNRSKKHSRPKCWWKILWWIKLKIWKTDRIWLILEEGRALCRQGRETARCGEGTDWTGLVGTELSAAWGFECRAERQTSTQLWDFQCVVRSLDLTLVAGRLQAYFNLDMRKFAGLVETGGESGGRWHYSHPTDLNWSGPSKNGEEEMSARGIVMDNWNALPAVSFWVVSSYLVCALPSLGIFNYRGKVRIRSSLWREYQIFLDKLRLQVGNVWQAVGNEGLKLKREVKAGGRNMAVISLRLIFEAMGRVKIFERENRKS